MEKQIFDLLKKLSKTKSEVTLDLHLKNDLGLDSILFVELAIEINEMFSVDLGEKFDQGHKIEYVKDLVKCLK